MSSRCLSALLGFAFATVLQARTLRVCASAENLPFSNRAGEGFDNKIAELVAAALGARIAYTWTDDSKALRAGSCDVLTGVPASLEDVITTEPYYRSSYVFVTRADRGLTITSVLDDQLMHLRIGIPIVGNDYAPPAAALAHRGITENITSFNVQAPRTLIDGVDNGTVDVAILWGPIAGFYAKQAPHPLTIASVSPPEFLGVPFTFDIAMAVRSNETELRNELNRALAQNAGAIKALLAQYGVPQLR